MLHLLSFGLTTSWPKLTYATLISLSIFTPATTKQLVANGSSRGQIVLLISMMPAFHLGQELPQLFSTVLLKAVRRMMAKRGFHVVVYLYDFLVIGRTAAECHAAYDTLLQLLTDLGLQISMHKLVPPTQRLVFLGVQLDTLLCQMSLPQPKLQDLQTLVSHFST